MRIDAWGDGHKLTAGGFGFLTQRRDEIDNAIPVTSSREPSHVTQTERDSPRTVPPVCKPGIVAGVRTTSNRFVGLSEPITGDLRLCDLTSYQNSFAI